MADLALLILTLFWGTTFTLVKEAIAVASPAVFLSLRFATAALVAGAIWWVRGDRPRAAAVRHGLLLGLFMFAAYGLQTEGLRFTTPARSGFLTGLSVLMVPFLSHFLLHQRVRAISWVGVAFAIVGLAVLTRPFDGLSTDVRLGDLLTIACAVAVALQIIYTGEWSARHPLALLTFVQIATVLVGSLLMLPIDGVMLQRGHLGPFLGVVAFTAIAMTTGASMIMNWAQRHTTAVRAALIYSLEPVSAALFSHFYGGEPLLPTDWIGGGLIVLGVVVGEVGRVRQPEPGTHAAAPTV